ncbi:hypothetical protein Tco_1184464 [Tanacetum coccineum]
MDLRKFVARGSVFQMGWPSIYRGQKMTVAGGVAFLDGALKLLRNLSYESGLRHLAISDHVSPGAWTLYYYQRAVMIFEQYSISAGSCQFSLAALEQVDVVLGLGIICSEAALFSILKIFHKVAHHLRPLLMPKSINQYRYIVDIVSANNQLYRKSFEDIRILVVVDVVEKSRKK